VKQIELYVPICDNDGRRIEIEHWTWLRDTLVRHFNGFSKYLVDGFYRGQQRDYAESCFIYRIVINDDCPDSRGEQDRLLNVVASVATWIKRYWKQESVLYTVSDVNATFV